MKALHVQEVRKKFGRRKILDGVSFCCRKGEILGVFGRNGAGKSTLLKSIVGTVKVDSIGLNIDGFPMRPSEVITSQRVGFLPQTSFLPKELKVREVIPLMFPRGEDQDKIFYSEGVARFDATQIGKLSLGELKYLEILLLGHLGHDFLLLDEPFSLVEPHYIEIIQGFLRGLKEMKGIILTDHYYRDVLEISDRSFLIKEGKSFKIENEEDLVTHNYLNSTEA